MFFWPIDYTLCMTYKYAKGENSAFKSRWQQDPSPRFSPFMPNTVLTAQQKRSTKLAAANSPLIKALLKTIAKPGHLCQYCRRGTLGRGPARRWKTPGAGVALGCVVVVGFKLQYLWKVQYTPLMRARRRVPPGLRHLYRISQRCRTEFYLQILENAAVQYWQTAKLFVTKDEKENGPAGINRGLGVRNAGLWPGSVFKRAV